MGEPLDAGAVVDRLRSLYGAARDQDLAEALGKPKTTVSSWRTRNRVPLDECVEAVRKFRTTFDWLLLGAGGHGVGEALAPYGDSPAGDRAQRLQAFVRDWAASRNEDEQAWLEMQILRAVPEYAEWLAGRKA